MQLNSLNPVSVALPATEAPARGADAPARLELLLMTGDLAFATPLRPELEHESGLRLRAVAGPAEAERQLREGARRIALAVLDLDLAGDTAATLLDTAAHARIPTVALAATWTDAAHAAVSARPLVMDCLARSHPHCAEGVALLARRIARNGRTRVLVVDDSPTARRHLARLLGTYGYCVAEAADGAEALKRLQGGEDADLVVTDYSMPRMDGFELVRRVRAQWPRDRMAVIGISSTGDPTLWSRFVKAGANDFLVKPFVDEEFHCRVSQSVELLEHMRALRESAVRDPLTGLHNRRYFFDAGAQLWAGARRRGAPIAAAMVDIDHFKRVNDTWGHDAGDAVIRHVATQLRARFRGADVVARLGGEEFCVLACDFEPAAAHAAFDALRAAIAATPAEVDGASIPVTASIGLCCAPADSLAALVKRADERLYEAKAGGRDQIVGD